MLRNLFVYGVLAGVIVGLPMCLMAVTLDKHLPLKWGMVIGYLTMLIALSMVFVGVKRYRDLERGGVIGFWQAFGLGLGISAVASVIYVLAWEFTMAITHMDFATGYARAVIDGQRAKGASDAQIAKVTAEMDAFKLQYANPLFRLPMTFIEIFPVGAIVSLIVAALLRNRRFLPARALASSA